MMNGVRTCIKPQTAFKGEDNEDNHEIEGVGSIAGFFLANVSDQATESARRC